MMLLANNSRVHTLLTCTNADVFMESRSTKMMPTENQHGAEKQICA